MNIIKLMIFKIEESKKILIRRLNMAKKKVDQRDEAFIGALGRGIGLPPQIGPKRKLVYATF